MGEGESCGIRRFAGALTGRGFRVYYVCMYIRARVPSRIPKTHWWKRWKDKRSLFFFLQRRAFSPRFGEKIHSWE